MVGLMGGPEAVSRAVFASLHSSDIQWALELADMLLTLEPDNLEIRRAKADGLLELARQETSANGRHYYIAYAREMIGNGS